MNKRKLTIWVASAAVVALLVGLIVVALAERRAQEQKIAELQELAELEKEEMKNEYEDFARQYAELQSQIVNDSLIAQLEKEQQRTEELLAELERTKSDDAAEIMRLKKELATLRAILRNYVMQIDSLNNLNRALSTENTSLRAENQQAQQHISNLSTEKKQLQTQVAIAAQLNATGISARSLNKRGKSAKKAKDVRRMEVSMTIDRNVTATTGMKTIYLRITTPTGSVLGRGGEIAYENRTVQYTAKRDMEYTGEEQSFTLYYDVSEALTAGAYHVDVFADGNVIGSSSFKLD